MLHIISESHLIERHYFKIPSYSIYHIIHPNGTEYGDIVIIIKNNIWYYELDNFKKDFLQDITVEIKNKSVVILSICCHIIVDKWTIWGFL